jgi:hypothetical protein
MAVAAAKYYRRLKDFADARRKVNATLIAAVSPAAGDDPFFVGKEDQTAIHAS